MGGGNEAQVSWEHFGFSFLALKKKGLWEALAFLSRG
jgi:hypothetical protein